MTLEEIHKRIGTLAFPSNGKKQLTAEDWRELITLLQILVNYLYQHQPELVSNHAEEVKVS